MIYTNLEFRADYPQSELPDADPAGLDIALYVSGVMNGQGFATTSAIQEDWGWSFFVTIDGFRVLVGCGAYPEYEDGWLCFVDVPKFHWRVLLKRKAAKAALGKSGAILHDAFSRNPRCYDRKWWTDKTGISPMVEC